MDALAGFLRQNSDVIVIGEVGELKFWLLLMLLYRDLHI